MAPQPQHRGGQLWSFRAPEVKLVHRFGADGRLYACHVTNDLVVKKTRVPPGELTPQPYPEIPYDPRLGLIEGRTHIPLPDDAYEDPKSAIQFCRSEYNGVSIKCTVMGGQEVCDGEAQDFGKLDKVTCMLNWPGYSPLVVELSEPNITYRARVARELCHAIAEWYKSKKDNEVAVAYGHEKWDLNDPAFELSNLLLWGLRKRPGKGKSVWLMDVFTEHKPLH